MRRTFLIGIAVLMGLSLAAPAFAQGRDPFEPRPGENEQETDGNEDSERDPFNPNPGDAEPAPNDPDPGPNDPDDPTDPVVDPTVDPAPTADPGPNDPDDRTLANTGFDSTTWAAIGYLLIVLGAAAIVVGRVFAPSWSRKR